MTNQWVNEEIKMGIKDYLKTNENKNTYVNLQDAAKADLRGKFIVINADIKKWEKLQRNNLTLHLEESIHDKRTKYSLWGKDSLFNK